MKTRNAEALADFTKYCQEHPDQRFWQALRNWSGWAFVYLSVRPAPGGTVEDNDENRRTFIKGLLDTYYWETHERPEGPNTI